ncbi:recombinase family protein [Eubacteriaceae bacterium ES3]|nr:recombinase family protein [Eubacteriaceae bacterium ES3]
MKVGYVRVSTEEQNEARQIEILNCLGAEEIYVDKVSGKDTNRPQFKKMMEYLRKGDTLVVESYSRLSRSTVDLIKTVERLNEKGVDFISQKEKIDTTTAQGKLMMTIFAGIYQFERECMLERQKEGIAIAKAEGKYKGRKPIEVDQKQFKEVYDEWKAEKIMAVEAMEKLNLSKPTFYRKVKAYEAKQNKGGDVIGGN